MLAPLCSFLSVVNDVPLNYTAENFWDELIELLVECQEDVLLNLKPHLGKMSKSYKYLVIDHAAGKALQSGINFYLCVAWLFISEPVLIIKPKPNPTPELGMTGPDYIFQKHYLIDADKFVASLKIKMRFIYNGVDYVTPFYKERIALVVRQGWPLLHDIMMCYTDLTALMKKMPDGKSINEGLQLMHRHLGIASAVAEHTNFTTGESNTSFAEEHPPLPLTLLLATSLRKCKASLKDANRKKQKVNSNIVDELAANLPLLSLDEHLATMDVAGELGGDDL